MAGIAALCIVTQSISAQAPTGCAIPRDACAFFDTFVSAFNQRDWSAFQATLAPEISVIFDRPGPPARQDGRAAVEAVFRQIFPEGATPAALPPSQIRPLNLRTQDMGDVVLVAFELAAPGAVGRRTLVLQRTAVGWRVVHIHGSSSISASPG